MLEREINKIKKKRKNELQQVRRARAKVEEAKDAIEDAQTEAREEIAKEKKRVLNTAGYSRKLAMTKKEAAAERDKLKEDAATSESVIGDLLERFAKLVRANSQEERTVEEQAEEEVSEDQLSPQERAAREKTYKFQGKRRLPMSWCV